jgi:hypothetical protein
LEIRFRVFFLFALCAGAFLTTSCVRPLGPGFRFADRQTEIRVSSGAPEQLHIRVADHLSSIGNLPLRSLKVRMPDEAGFGARNLRVIMEGNEVSPEHSSSMDRRLMSAAFDPGWERPQPREIVTEWELTPQLSARGTIGVSAAGFYIADETALPLWQPPNGVFTKGGPTPERETLTVFVPSDYRVLAPGKPLKRVAAGNMVARRFRIQPDKDFLPYVVAGRYQEQIIRAAQTTVNFWTFQPLDASVAQIAALRLSSSVRALTDFYGPASKGKSIIHIAEAPGDLRDEFGEGTDPGGASFPNGVLLSPRAVAQGVANEAVLQLAEYELARTWFGWRVRPRPEAQILMGRGIGLFGLVIAAEARGQDQRGRMITSLLERYNEAVHIAADRKLVEPAAEYSRAERITTGYKAALFFVALEDLCGRDNLRTAFRNIIHARGGDQAGHEELRAAAESASRRDLAEIFRAWFNRPGIPEDFRTRYGRASSEHIEN